MSSFVVFVIVFSLAVPAADAQRPPPAPVTGQTLQQVAGSLKMYVDPLPDMPKLNGYSGSGNSRRPGSLTIGMYQKKWQFHRDLPPTTVFVYGTSLANATFPGPTIIAKQGTPLQVTWQNHLPQHHILPIDTTVPTAIPKNGGVPTVVHLHGGVHEPQSDGSALAWFTADFSEKGPKWTKATYTYPNILHAANLWYHDHALGLTRANLLAGLIGAYNIQNDDVETPFDLPCDEYDRHLIIVDRNFNVDGSLYMNSTGDNPTIHPEWQPEYFGEAIIVNGKAWPYLTVKPRRYRFRILNASNARYLRLSLSNGLQFIVIGSDSSYLNAPVATPSVLLAPAEISDVVIDFSRLTSNETELSNDAPYPYPTGSPAGPLNGKVMKFVIARPNPTQPDNSTIPVKQVNYPLPSAADATVTRYIAMYEYLSPAGLSTHLYINGKRFEDPATESPKVGSIELWEVINLTGDNHPLHIHLGLFQRIKVQQLVNLTDFQNCMSASNDAVACNISRHATGPTMEVPEYEKTWKNVVKMEPGYVTSVIVRFNLVDQKSQYPFDPTAEPGYVYHCHILDHEDNAMIRPLKMVA